MSTRLEVSRILTGRKFRAAPVQGEYVLALNGLKPI